MKINRYDIPAQPLDYPTSNNVSGQWCRAIDVERIEQSNTELLQTIEAIDNAVKIGCPVGTILEIIRKYRKNARKAHAAIAKAEGGGQHHA